MAERLTLRPFYSIETELSDGINTVGVDIVDRVNIHSFSYVQKQKGADVVTLRGSLPVGNFEALDDEWLVVGKEITFIFGYKGGAQSRPHIARISDIKTCFEQSSVKLTIEATDLGLFMKKNSTNNNYAGLTASEIVAIIADEYGLEKKIEDTPARFPKCPQAGRSDCDFIKYLARISDKVFFMRGNLLCFVDRDLAQESRKTYIYCEPEGEMIRFCPEVSHTKQGGESREVKSKGQNLDENAQVTNTVTGGSAQEVAKGDFETYYDLDGIKIPQNQPPGATTGNSTTDDTGQLIVVTANDNESAQNVLKSRLKEAKLKVLTADLTALLEPNVDAGEIITIGGVSRKFQGNYLIDEITHTISSGSSRTMMKLQKNASSEPVTETVTEVEEGQVVNDTIGAEQADTSQPVDELFYDLNGNLVDAEGNPQQNNGEI